MLLRRVILDQKLGDEADFKRLEREVAEEVTASVKFADESPFPDTSDLYDDVFVE